MISKVECLEAIIALGSVDINMKDNNSCTPVYYAQKNGYRSC